MNDELYHVLLDKDGGREIAAGSRQAIRAAAKLILGHAIIRWSDRYYTIMTGEPVEYAPRSDVSDKEMPP